MSKERVLIVDDDIELCEEMAEILRGEDYYVKNVSDPDQAVGLINAYKFDIVILDYKLPSLDGIELLRKAKEKSPDSRVFIVSGRPFMEKLLEEGKASHLVAGVICKPFNCDVLLEKIKK